MFAENHVHTKRWSLGIGRVVVTLVALLLLSSVALAAVPTTGTFAGVDTARAQRVTFTLPGRTTTVTDWAGALNLQLDKDTKGDRQGPLVKVFCIQLFVVVGRPGSVDTYYSNGSVTAIQPGGCYIRYIVGRYPASNITTQAEGAARQLAIWHFSDGLDLSTVTDAAIRVRAQALADEAQTQVDTNGCPGTNSGLASLTLTPANATVPQGQPVQYTVQLSPASAASSVTITVDSPATLDNGTQSATLTLNNGAATFTVTNTTPGVINVTAQVDNVMDEGTVFESDKQPKTQRLVLGQSITLTASAQVQVVFQEATATATATPTETQAATQTPTATSTPGGATETATTIPTSTSTPVISTETATPRRPTRTPGQGGDATPTSTQTTDVTVTPTTPTNNGGEVTPTIVSNEELTPSPVTGDQGTPTVSAGEVTPTTNQNQALQPKGTKPRSLPNTGDTSANHLDEWLLAIAISLVLAGIALQRRGARR